MFESVVFTLINNKVLHSTEAMFADMAGLDEDRLLEQMKTFGFTALLRISSDDPGLPVLISFTKRIIYKEEISAF